jgi:Ca2+:H+ antiporter
MPADVAHHHLETTEWMTLIAAAVLTVATVGVHFGHAPAVAQFVVAGLGLAALAAVVGQAIEQVGERLSSSATAVLQSTLGNLPELFVGIFALDKGLVGVVRSALVGSILGNAVLVLGCVFLAGGLRHGPQRFEPEEPRLNASLLLLVVGALMVPTLATKLGTPAAPHATALSDVCAVVLLLVYAATVPYYLRRRPGSPALASNPAADPNPVPDPNPAPDPNSGPNPGPTATPTGSTGRPLRYSIVRLVVASLGAALVSDWFVEPLHAATSSLGISETFTGLVIVALASNAVEHAVGIRFALRAKPEFAISTTLNSPLQVALLLTPVLVLLSSVVGPTRLTLVFPPLLVAALAISALVVAVVIYDGEYTWIEGVALIALYCMIAAGFWWG